MMEGLLGAWTALALSGLVLAFVRAERNEAEDPDDRLLLLLAADGDNAAFNRLLRRYHRRIYSFCLRLLGDAHEAEELTQDVFVTLHGNLDRFRGDALFSTWLFQIARNQSLNKLKYLRRRRFFSNQSLEQNAGDRREPLAIADEAKDAYGQCEERELRDLVQARIARLPAATRALLILREIEGLSYAEIAGRTGLPEGTVKSRLHRARLELRQGLSHYF